MLLRINPPVEAHLVPALVITGLNNLGRTTKSHCTTYPLRLNKSSISLAIIHSNVWGPSQVSTMSGFKFLSGL